MFTEGVRYRLCKRCLNRRCTSLREHLNLQLYGLKDATSNIPIIFTGRCDSISLTAAAKNHPISLLVHIPERYWVLSKILKFMKFTKTAVCGIWILVSKVISYSFYHIYLILPNISFLDDTFLKMNVRHSPVQHKQKVTGFGFL